MESEFARPATFIGNELGDVVQPFQLESVGIRGRLVRLGPALDAILRPHRYPADVGTLLAETVTMAAVLASGLKYEGVFTLQTKGDGPVGMMVADMTSAGVLRGYARVDAGRLAGEGGPSGPIPRLLGAGHMAFTVDQGPDTERYQGITELTGSTLADCAHNYFRRSEQLETALALFAETVEDADGRALGARAGALVLQHLPAESPSGAAEGGAREEEAEENWRRVVILMGSLAAGEILNPELSPRDVLYRLYHQEGVRVYQSRPLVHGCRCSRQRVETTLRSFPRDEIEAMNEHGMVTVTCEFCKTDYAFDVAQVEALYAP